MSPRSQPPSTQIPTIPSRKRGGAPKGNLNALKHGRYSRRVQAAHRQAAADAGRPTLDLAALVDTLYAQQQREAARVLRALARLANSARYERERAAAIAAGRPLPHPPLLPARLIDIERLQEFTQAHFDRAYEEKARRLGMLPPGHPQQAESDAKSANLDTIIAGVLKSLDHAAHTTSLPAPLAAFLTAENNPTPSEQPESAEVKQPPDLNPAGENHQNNQSTRSHLHDRPSAPRAGP